VKKRFFLISLLLVAVTTLWWWQRQSAHLISAPAVSRASTALLRVSFLDVGQGDAIAVETPGGRQMLIDGGDSGEKLLAALNALPDWQQRLDYEVLTHPHDDHLSGLNALFDRLTIGQVVATLVAADNGAYDYWQNNIKERRIPLTVAMAGQVYDSGDGVSWRVLSPANSLEDQAVNNLNNSSVVLLLSYGQIRFLLMGDAETPVEEALLNQGTDARAQVLKVGHHGSTSATGQAWLKAVKPQLAVISVGANNDFGHPHERVLRRLARAGVIILRTDQLGTVTLVTDGQTLTRVEN